MTETVHAFGETEARRIAEVDRLVLGNGPGTRVESFDNPVPLEAVAIGLSSEAPDPGTSTPAVLLDSQRAEVRDIDVECLEHIAIPVGRFGFAIAPPRFLAVLIDDLPKAPAVYATGTTTLGSDQVTTSLDLSEYIDDYIILIDGADVDGGLLEAVIDAATPTGITISKTAATEVTDANITLLAVADVWILEVADNGRLVRKMKDGEPVEREITNRMRHIGPAANTLIGIEYVDEWRPYQSDCDVTEWEWPEVMS